MKSLELSSLLLGFGLFCLGCQQKSSKENAPETSPAASAVAKRTGETPATAAKTGEKKASEHPAKVDDRLEAERLIANLKDRDWFVRREATEALGKLGDKRAVEPLIACLKDEDNSVRLNAAYALGKLGDKRAVEPLIACLKDSDVNRAFAAEALGKLGDKRAVEPLIACLKDNAVDRSCTAEALGKLGDKRAVGPLIAALKDEDERVRRGCGGPWQAGRQAGRGAADRRTAGLARQGRDWRCTETTRRQACDGQRAILLPRRRTGRQGTAGRLEANQAADPGRCRITGCKKSAERRLYGDCAGQGGNGR